jgi:2-deoxy-D-gluconate 3-dehydrogenase
VVCDLADGGAVSQLIGTITASHSFDILVNNAGIQRRSPAALFPQDAYEELMQVNVSATFALCRDTGKFWIDHGIQGRLINIASLASFQGGVNIPAYAASKGAVAQLTKAFSNEWAKHGIRVNAIAPGYYD